MKNSTWFVERINSHSKKDRGEQKKEETLAWHWSSSFKEFYSLFEWRIFLSRCSSSDHKHIVSILSSSGHFDQKSIFGIKFSEVFINDSKSKNFKYLMTEFSSRLGLRFDKKMFLISFVVGRREKNEMRKVGQQFHLHRFSFISKTKATAKKDFSSSLICLIVTATTTLRTNDLERISEFSFW